MVVILLLTRSTTNGCDGGSNESTSTTSTGVTAIPTAAYRAYQQQQDYYNNQLQQEQQQNLQQQQQSELSSQHHHNHHHHQYPAESKRPSTRYANNGGPPQTTTHKKPYKVTFELDKSYHRDDSEVDSPLLANHRHSSSHLPLSPSPPPLPKSLPPNIQPCVHPSTINALPKPPRRKQLRNTAASAERQYNPALPSTSSLLEQPLLNSNTVTNTKDYVRHVTRVNFYDVDCLQVDYGNDDDDSCDTEAITKEEEWITKKKTELTTTRQIETRVKRQVVLEDGKVIEDSGPIVSTNTTEDTDKQETETTERRDLGSPKPLAIEADKDEVDNATSGNQLAATNDGQMENFGGTVIQKFVPRPADGLVREINEKRVVSREEIKDRLETEDVRHLGDFSDEAYVNAVNSGAENIETILYSPESQKQLVPTGPRIIQQSTKGHKTIDTEDIQQRSLAQADGPLVTEKKNTTEHEEIFDEELPEKDDNSTGSKEKIFTTESSQRFLKQRDEQNVEFVVDGKVISKEMRYAAETEQMERDGAPDRPGDWDSLSARIRKARRAPKTLLQQQKEAALLSDRKDALTKRPLDFDREEETRKGETMKWLESHFGSESTASNDSRDDYQEIEPTKKTYFNVTIKSNPTTPPNVMPVNPGLIHSAGQPARVIITDHDPEKAKTYFQGISNWADRKESTPKHFASKAFRDELKGTLDSRNRIRQSASREDLSSYYPKESAATRNETYVTREDILQQKRQYNSRSDLRYRSSSREDLVDMKNIRSQKEDLGYLSGSRTDVRYHRPDSNDENIRNLKNAKNASYLKREDSGYVKDSSEDVTSSHLRCDGEEDGKIVAEKYRSGMMVQDDSAYVSSPTYFNENRLPKTPEHALGSRSPEIVSHDATLSRPAVPQRRRGIEKKVRQQPVPIVAPKFHHRDEPPPDYSPPPQSRSASPTQTRYNAPPPPALSPYTAPANIPTANGVSSRKSNQRTRFASESSSASQHQMRPSMSTQTTQTSLPPSGGGGGSNKQSSTKVGQAIGNSFRKLVGKIRSASAERKFRMKSKSKSRDKSPINGGGPPSPNGAGMSTYQQYNVIDSHIGGGNGGGGGGQAGSSTVTTTSSTQPSNTHHSHSHSHSQLQQRNSAPINRESSVVSSSTAVGRDSRPSQTVNGNQYANSAENRRGSSDLDVMGNPKQRYYLGEDPYAGGLFGKENKYDAGAARRARESRDTIDSNYPRDNGGPVTVGVAAVPPPSGSQYHRLRRAGSSDENREIYVQRKITSNTLGRYQKNNHRIGSTPDLNYDYRSAHTLPRKLDNHRTPTTQPQHHSSKINVSIVNQLKPPQNTGPAKPARTYKTLNRSKSFNVYGLNGTNDPSPIYIEKLTKNNYSNNSAIGSSNMYKSNPHLYIPENAPLQSGLKSPSIVNLISRSQKDLTRIDETDRHYERRLSSAPVTANNHTNGSDSKRNVFLEGLRDQAPDLYKTLHGDEPDLSSPPSRNVFKYSHLTGREPNASPSGGASRSPAVELIRRGSSSTEDYSETYKYTTRSDDPNRPLVTDTVQTFSKKTIPSKDGRGVETIQSSERQSVTKSHQYRSDPMPKYIDEHKRRSFGNVGGSTIIEVRRK